MMILLNVWILPIGGVASGRLCACRLRSRHVLRKCCVICVDMVGQVKFAMYGYNSNLFWKGLVLINFFGFVG